MKNISIICFIIFLPIIAFSQSDPHYTMFMYNKLMYNPAYAGSRDYASVNGTYRDQWVGLDGAPKTINISADGPIGSYMNEFRKVALGISLNNESIGVENSTNLMSYYAYRIQAKKTVISMGLSAGFKMYSADYSKLNLYQTGDPNFMHDIKGAFLPNFGTGVFWSSDKFYLGFSIPNLLQNYYDRSGTKLNNDSAREIRGYYLSGGMVFPAGENIKIQPQFLYRYAGNATYQLPADCDFNVSLIFNNRFMIGFTYRTDKSVEGIVHLQVYKNLNLGYAFDYMLSGLSSYNSGTHEIIIGYDFIRDNSKLATPRFIKSF